MEAQSAGRRARARAIGWLIGGGAAMVLIWVALGMRERDPVVVGFVLATWLLAGLLLSGRFDRASQRAALAVMIVAAVLISGALLAIGDPTSGFARFYVCLAPYAFATSRARLAVALLAVVAVLYAAVLAILVAGEHDTVVSDSIAWRWLVVVAGSVAL